MNLLLIILVAAGGAIGSVLRFLLSELVLLKTSQQDFPYHLLLVNVLGSLVVGILFYVFVEHLSGFDTTKSRSFFIAGVLGGFTTFSAFSLDAFRLLTAGKITAAMLFICSSVMLSILATFLGFYGTKLALS